METEMINVAELVKTQNRDAAKWAEAFIETCQKNGTEAMHEDFGFVVGWFANAMMAMHDSIYNNEIKKLQSENEKLKEILTEEHGACLECVEAKLKGFTICGDCSCK